MSDQSDDRSDDRADDDAGEPGWDGPLPEAVRLRVLALASDALGALPDDEVPVAL